MLWFIIVIFAYFLNAGATLIQKWLLIKDIPNPMVFTFYIGVLNMIALVLIPFGFFVPSFSHIVTALVSGAAFALGMYYLAEALHNDEASQVAPIVGGLQPIFVLLFALWFLPERLVAIQYFGIVLLVIGSLFMAFEIGARRLFAKSLRYILLSSVFFGLSYATLKLVYLQQGFVSGFVWTRFGTFFLVAALALLPGNWRKIKENFQKSGEKIKGLFVFSQVAGAVSFLLVAYAISLGPVMTINALQGIQYVFLFLFVVVLARRHPRLLDEPLTRSIVAQKTIAILLIMAGLALVI